MDLGLAPGDGLVWFGAPQSSAAWGNAMILLGSPQASAAHLQWKLRPNMSAESYWEVRLERGGTLSCLKGFICVWEKECIILNNPLSIVLCEIVPLTHSP